MRTTLTLNQSCPRKRRPQMTLTLMLIDQIEPWWTSYTDYQRTQSDRFPLKVYRWKYGWNYQWFSSFRLLQWFRAYQSCLWNAAAACLKTLSNGQTTCGCCFSSLCWRGLPVWPWCMSTTASSTTIRSKSCRFTRPACSSTTSWSACSASTSYNFTTSECWAG